MAADQSSIKDDTFADVNVSKSGYNSRYNSKKKFRPL